MPPPEWLQDGYKLDGKGHCLAWLVPALPSFRLTRHIHRGVGRGLSHQGLALPSAEYFSLTVGTAV